MNSKAAILFSVCFLAPIASAVPAGIQLPTPANAKNVQHLNPKGAWLQTSFTVEAKYPNASVASFYVENVHAPWIRCFSGIPKWDSFGDIAQGRNRFVHQILMPWINRKDKKLLLVGLHYYSEGSQSRCDPNNDTQYVTVAEYPAEDMEQTIKLLELKCNE